MTIVTLKDEVANIQELSADELDQVTAAAAPGSIFLPVAILVVAAATTIGASVYGFFRALFAGELV